MISSLKRGLSGFMPLFIVGYALICLLCFIPLQALAEESKDIPEGVLTLCDDPFIVDDGHGVEGSDLSSSGFENEEMSASEALDRDVSPLAQMLSDDDKAMPVSDYESPQDDSKDVDAEIQVGATIESPSSDGASNNASFDLGIRSSSSETACVVADEDGATPYEDAAVLVEVTPGITREALNELLSLTEGLSASDVSDEDLAYGLVRLAISDNSSVLEIIDRIRAVDGFINVQPNYVYSLEDTGSYTVVNDRYISRQWELESVNAFPAWDIAKTQNSVAVAIIDTGADLDHPDLESNIVATHNSLSAVNTVEDTLGHGSHIAGIVAGVANNTRGVAGASYNANLVIIKATPYKSNDFTTESIARAYAWLESLDSSGKTVAEHYNVRIVNLSLGGLDSARSANLADNILINAIIKARDEYGLLTIASAGNGSGSRLPYATFPGDSDACLSVMNLAKVTDKETGATSVALHDTSNFNVAGTTCKDICAPGTEIVSTWLNGGFALNSGTSMAAPVVSGIAAMLFAVNPYLTPQMVMSILESTATDLGEDGWDERYGYGEVNAAAAVRLANASHIDGFSVVGVGGSAGFSASLELGMTEDGSGRTWRVVPGSGKASVDENGVLIGTVAGDVTLFSTCKAATGAEISAAKIVYVLNSEIVGDSSVAAGTVSTEYTTTDPSWTWVWQVENDTGEAHIDQDAILVADKAGVVYVTATCASNTDIVLRKRVTIVA